ncbi:MAG: hypothetical protein RLZZ417_2831 [Bacteroidota bacterium]
MRHKKNMAMNNSTIKFFLILILFFLLFVVALFTKDVIRTNLMAAISLLLFISGIKSLNQNSLKKN